MAECKYAYRVIGDVSLHCMAQKESGARHDYCAHQYLCAQTRRWEVSSGAGKCEILQNEKE